MVIEMLVSDVRHHRDVNWDAKGAILRQSVRRYLEDQIFSTGVAHLGDAAEAFGRQMSWQCQSHLFAEFLTGDEVFEGCLRLCELLFFFGLVS